MPPLPRRWPVLVPLVWFAIVMGFIRPDAIEARAEVPWELKWLLYDESDLAALALRGANSQAGRLPGRPDEPEWSEPEELEKKLDTPQPGYAPRYYLEYPTAALGLFRLGFLIQPGADDLPLPPAVADSHHNAVAHFVPRTDEERRLWTRLSVAVRFYVAVMTAGLVGLILVVGRGYEPGQPRGGPVWLMALPGAVFFSLNRFDVLPALATALGFACLGRRRLGWAGVWLAVGALLKVYPVLFVPVVLRYLGVRHSVRFAVMFGLTAAAGFGLSLLLLDWEGTLGPIRVQLSRSLEERSWTYYGRLLPMELGHWKEGRLGLLCLAVLAAILTRPADLNSVLRRCGAVLVVFVSLAVFWSPQWIVWFLPLVVPLARRRWEYVVPAIGLDLLNYYTFPVLFWVNWNQWPTDVCRFLAETLVYVRAGAWLQLAAVFLWDEWTARRLDPRAAFPANRSALLEAFLKAAEAAGRPRGLRWVGVEPAGEPVFVRDGETTVALLPAVVQFEPVEGSELADVPQAREPRTVTAVFTFDGRGWTTVGRAVFNLTPDQVAAQERYRPIG